LLRLRIKGLLHLGDGQLAQYLHSLGLKNRSGRLKLESFGSDGTFLLKENCDMLSKFYGVVFFNIMAINKEHPVR
jgi:hypothetical protein